MTYAKLKAIRDKLAAVRAVTTDDETLQALCEAIDEMDDIIVDFVRAETFARIEHEAAPVQPFSMVDFANDLLAGMTSVQTMAVAS